MADRKNAPKGRKSKPGRVQSAAEVLGYGCAVAGLGCLGFVIAGPVLAAAFALIVLAAVLILVGNL